MAERDGDGPDSKRIAALDSLGILDTPPEPEFGDLELLAGELCAAPVSLASLVAAEQ